MLILPKYNINRTHAIYKKKKFMKAFYLKIGRSDKQFWNNE